MCVCVCRFAQLLSKSTAFQKKHKLLINNLEFHFTVHVMIIQQQNWSVWSHLSPGLQRLVQRVYGVLAGGGLKQL